MSASTTRQVRHKIPLPLSIVARPHEAGPILSWRADSLALVWLDPGITPCCKSLKRRSGQFLAKERNERQSPINTASNPLRESPVSLARGDLSPHIIIQSPRLRGGEFESHLQKRLLQQYPPTPDLAARSAFDRVLEFRARYPYRLNVRNHPRPIASLSFSSICQTALR